MNTCPNPTLTNTEKCMHINICTHIYIYLRVFKDKSSEARRRQFIAEGFLEWDLGEWSNYVGLPQALQLDFHIYEMENLVGSYQIAFSFYIATYTEGPLGKSNKGRAALAPGWVWLHQGAVPGAEGNHLQFSNPGSGWPLPPGLLRVSAGRKLFPSHG